MPDETPVDYPGRNQDTFFPTTYDGAPLVLPRQEADDIVARTPNELKVGLRQAHATGPVPDELYAIRAQAFGSFTDSSKIHTDPVYAYLGKLAPAQL